MEMAFRDCVNEAKERGQTVFLSSHILSEVEALCDRVGILRAGRLVDEGTLERAAPPQRADGRGHVRRPGARAPGAARRARARARARTRCASRSPGGVGPLIAALAGTSRRDAHEPRAVARGDLPAPLRRLRRPCRRLAQPRRPRRRRRRPPAVRSRARRAGVPRRPDPHDRVRLPVRRARLHPAGRLPPRLPDARPTGSRSRTASATTRRVRLFYGVAVRPADGRRLHRLAGRRDAGDLRRRVRAAGRGARAAGRGGRRADASSSSPGSSAGARRTSRRWRRSRAGIAVLWVAEFAGSARGGPAGRRRRPTSRSRRASVIPVFVGVGALASQLAPTRRIALELGRRRRRRCRCCCAWSPTPRAAPAGCAGRRRSAGPRSCGRSPAPARLVLLLPLRPRVLLLAAAARIAAAPRRRHAVCCPRTRHRRAATAAARPRRPRRRCAPSAAACSSGSASVGAFAFILGVISKSISSAGISKSLQQRAREARLRLDR